MTGARRISLILSAGMVGCLFAPWFVHTTVTHGLRGPRHLRESLTGWDALPAAAYACMAVAVLVWILLFTRSAAVVSGLGADGRRAARARVDGILIMLLGLTAVAWLAGALADRPGSSAPAVGAVTTVGVRWGVALALVPALGLAGLGVLIVLAAARPVRIRVPQRSSARRSSRSAMRVSRTVRAVPDDHRDATTAPPPDPAMPDFDFAVSDEPVPSSPGSARRRAGGRR
jgi:hypothetical protein